MIDCKRITETDFNQITNQLHSELQVCVGCTELTTAEEEKLNLTLKHILSSLGKDDIFNYISYIYRELINNAKKGNIKRYYFELKNINIQKKDEYEKGMEEFKKDLFTNVDAFSNELEQKGLYIKTKYHIKNESLTMTIINNTGLTQEESKIINDKIKTQKHLLQLKKQ